MGRVVNQIKEAWADRLIRELGGVTKTAKICHIATSSVCAWHKQGVPRARVMYLRLKFPKLEIWEDLADEQE